jgi:hypothetical protein
LFGRHQSWKTRATIFPTLVIICRKTIRGKEVKIMNYTKPEIAKCGIALVAIQSSPPKPIGTAYDSVLHARVGTMNAYEADE